MSRTAGAVFAVSAFALSSLALAAPAHAACAADGSQLTYHQMIVRGTTGDAYYHRMILGRVITIRDPGKQGGKATAVLAVRAHPTGFVPDIARIRFKAAPPGSPSPEDYFPGFAIGSRYVVIGRHVHDGAYEFSPWCAQSGLLHPWRFHKLLRLAGTVA